MTGVEAYPLQWPEGWPRGTARSAAFNTGLATARDALLNELRLLGAQYVVISTNVELRRDGLPYANRAQPDDRAVAVYFMRDGKQQCIPCDKWNRVEDNIQAIRKTVEALRGLERWGAKSMVDAAFSGFKALPAAGSKMTEHEALEFLRISAGWNAGPDHDDPNDIAAAYKDAAKNHHPDRGGSTEHFQKLQEVMRVLETVR